MAARSGVAATLREAERMERMCLAKHVYLTWAAAERVRHLIERAHRKRMRVYECGLGGIVHYHLATVHGKPKARRKGKARRHDQTLRKSA